MNRRKFFTAISVMAIASVLKGRTIPDYAPDIDYEWQTHRFVRAVTSVAPKMTGGEMSLEFSADSVEWRAADGPCDVKFAAVHTINGKCIGMWKVDEQTGILEPIGQSDSSRISLTLT